MIVHHYVPDSADEDEMERSVAAAARAAFRKELERSRFNQSVLETDDGFARLQKECKVPLVRANTYPGMGASVGKHELAEFFFRCDPRRPVIMRGSRYLSRANRGDNTHAFDIAERYLRYTQWTCFDREESIRTLDAIAKNLRGKFHLSYHFRKWIEQLRCGWRRFDQYGTCFIRGQRHVCYRAKNFDFLQFNWTTLSDPEAADAGHAPEFHDEHRWSLATDSERAMCLRIAAWSGDDIIEPEPCPVIEYAPIDPQSRPLNRQERRKASDLAIKLLNSKEIENV
jgi:hypothetical protein